MTMLIPLHKNKETLLSLLMDTFKLPMLGINTSSLILLLMLMSVLCLLEMGIGRPDGMLTRLCLRTIPFQKHEINYAVVGLAFFLIVLGCFGFMRDFSVLFFSGT